MIALIAMPLSPRLWTLLLLLPASLAGAGVVELYNGDRLEGEFISADEEQLVWRSEALGRLTLDKSDIYDLRTSKPLKINGVGEPCQIEGMEAEHLVYFCGDDRVPRQVPLVSLAMMIPYEDYLTGESASLSGRVNLSGTYARGNEVKDDWVLSSKVEYRMVDWRHSGGFEYASYSLAEAEPDVRWDGRYDLDWFFRERWFLSSSLRFGRDESRAVARYYNLGAGTGYQFWENSDAALAMTGGLVLVSERFRTPSNPGPDFVKEEERIAYRVGTDFRHQLPFGVDFFHRNEHVRSFEQGSDWQLTTTTGLSSTLVERLRSEIRFRYEVDNEPQPDTEREDIRLQVGLSYEW